MAQSLVFVCVCVWSPFRTGAAVLLYRVSSSPGNIAIPGIELYSVLLIQSMSRPDGLVVALECY